MTIDVLDAGRGLKIYYRGPGLVHKQLPTFIYFALSGEESLHLDPYNQPVKLFEDALVHVFSFTLPGHGPGYDNKLAIQWWSDRLASGEDIIREFIARCIDNLSFLIEEGFVDIQRIGVGGLSRGAFIATHLAAADSRIGVILGYAPLTQLSTPEEFAHCRHLPLIQSLDLGRVADKLTEKKIRYYIGNRDVRVGTGECFETIRAYTEAAYSQGNRSPAVELIISPSIGFKGHGTAPQVFKSGVEWLKDQFNIDERR